MDRKKVLNLAKLARIELGDKEVENLTREFADILNYVGEIKGVQANSLQLTADSFPIRNVMREDEEPHESGIYTDKILAQAPSKESGYVKVKKIL